MQWADPQKLEGIVGTNVKYAAAQEYGFDGTANVRDHLRKIVETSKLGLLGRTTVQAHKRHMHLPERSFLRSALEELEDALVNDIKKDIDGGLR
jgi:phage gpG-like protein